MRLYKVCGLLRWTQSRLGFICRDCIISDGWWQTEKENVVVLMLWSTKPNPNIIFMLEVDWQNERRAIAYCEKA